MTTPTSSTASAIEILEQEIATLNSMIADAEEQIDCFERAKYGHMDFRRYLNTRLEQLKEGVTA